MTLNPKNITRGVGLLMVVTILAIGLGGRAGTAHASPFAPAFSWGGEWLEDAFQVVDVSVGPNGTVYVANEDGNSIDRFTIEGSFLGRSNLGRDFGRDIEASGPGPVYMPAPKDDRVLILDRKGRVKRTLTGGGGEGRFDSPRYVSSGPDGSLFVLDFPGTPRVQQFSRSDQRISSIELALPAGASSPVFDMAADGLGHLYLLSVEADRLVVLKYDLNGNLVDKWFGRSVVKSMKFGWSLVRENVSLNVTAGGSVLFSDGAEINEVSDVGLPIRTWDRITTSTAPAPGGDVIAVSAFDEVRRLAPDGTVVNRWHSGAIPGRKGKFGDPGAVEFTGNRVYVLDDVNRRVQIFRRNGRPLRSWPVRMSEYAGAGYEEFYRGSLAVGNRGTVYLAGNSGLSVARFARNGRRINEFQVGGPGRCPSEGSDRAGDSGRVDALATDGQGTLYVFDAGGGCVLKFTKSGRYLGHWRNIPGARPKWGGESDIAIAGNGRAYLLVEGTRKVSWLRPDGRRGGSWGGPRSGRPGLRFPSALDLDSRGRVYVADAWKDRVYRFGPRGRRLGSFGGHGGSRKRLRAPWGVAASRSGRRVYVSNSATARIKVFKLKHRRR